MKKISFLSKLKKEGKLQLIETSEEVKKSYLEKSESNLISSKILFENNRLEESVSLSYYSMYNILMALFFRIGVKSENHTASIILLNELFELDNSQIKFAKKERIDKQYYADFKITKKDTGDLIKIAEEFNGNILDFISKLNKEKIDLFRKKFEELFRGGNGKTEC